MRPALGWGLAALLVAAAGVVYGWQGALLAVSAVVFWLLLQFNRVVRVMKKAADRPIGHVDSAVMLQAALKRNMTMLEVVTLTRSLGRRDSAEHEDDWTWTDAGGARVRLHFEKARLDRWSLERPGAPGLP